MGVPGSRKRGLADRKVIGQARLDATRARAEALHVSDKKKAQLMAQAASEADAKVDHADLTALLYFQGYKADSFFKVEMGR